jgi:hypothetical protein
VSAVLANEIDHLVRVNAMSKGDLGRSLSLRGIWSNGHLYRSQHNAMRALMLCQAVYLQWPWARQQEGIREAIKSPEGKVTGYAITGYNFVPFPCAWQTDVSTAVVRNMSEKSIKERILCYLPRPAASADDLATAAACVEGIELGSIDYRNYTRNDKCRFQTSICYDGVKQFLFKAGFLSIRWLTREGPSLLAHTANDMLGNGIVIPKSQLDLIPAGWIFNFHGGNFGGRENKDVCHWGVSLGGGIGAGTNTTPAEKGKKVNFIAGAGIGAWGKFRLSEAYDVCELKYRGDKGCDTVIRKIDPTTIGNLY